MIPKSGKILLAGKEYGSGSSRDWAAKGAFLLSIKAIIAESYERIHRSNLVGNGCSTSSIQAGDTAEKLGLTGNELFTITGIAKDIKPLKRVQVIAKKKMEAKLNSRQLPAWIQKLKSGITEMGNITICIKAIFG